MRTLSAGPLLRARNAELAGDRAQARAALEPGARAGLRVVIAYAVVGGIILAVLATAFILALVDGLGRRRILQALGAVSAAPPTAVSWGPGAALIVLAVESLATVAIGQGLALLAPLLGTAPSPIALAILATILGAVLTLGGFQYLRGRPWWAWGDFGWRYQRGDLWRGLCAFLLVLPLVWLASLLSALILRGDQEVHQLVPLLFDAHDPWLAALLIGAAVLMAPVLEETFFRGILFRGFAAAWAFWPAAIASALLFALMHRQLGALLPIGVLAVAMAILMRRTGRLWPSVVLHASFNGLSIVFVLLLAWATRGPGIP